MVLSPKTAKPSPDSASPALPHGGWIWLALGLVIIVIIRVPLVLNASVHLDSDLAVDGLTLVDALNGHWRWHYPATPFIGSAAVLLSYVQARIWGPTPSTLVSGGVVAYGVVVLGAYLLNRRAFGPWVAAWGLIPLAFASTGTVWLAGRVTGGHLLATAWHAGAFALLWGALAIGGWRRSAILGLWCGFGLSIDSMFAATWAGIAVATCVLACVSMRGRGMMTSSACLLAFGLASILGVMPRLVGVWVDPHDAYVGQFDPVNRVDRVARNAQILLLDCLPRLVAGHRLPGLQAEPDPAKLEGRLPESSPAKGVPGWGLTATVASLSSQSKGMPGWELAATVASLGLFGWAMLALATGGSTPDPAGVAIRLGLLTSSLAVMAGFLVHPTITGSEHYRYLVFLLIPWSTGFGLVMARLASKGRGGLWMVAALAVGFASLMIGDCRSWYGRLGWVDSSGLPIRKTTVEPAVDWLDDHPEVSTILGDYWDVYRISFLTRGRVRAASFPEYPDRFPEVRRALPGASHPVVIVRPGPFGPVYRSRALQAGGRELWRARGLSIVEWPGGMTP